ncbi:hypothetical protein [Cryobacterium sp. Y62]|uniref:hypothetical protein n=1 Tax=Cryobacterium sp. Y62 TaxID=2048284 RepID=UPI0013050471|nr:hypothetical protein [Cryobacterium sp. Y62]
MSSLDNPPISLIELAAIAIDQRDLSQVPAGQPTSGGIRFTKSAIRRSRLYLLPI